MLIRNPSPRYPDPTPSMRRRPRWNLLLGCLPLSAFLLALFTCGLMGAVVSLGWLTAPTETVRMTRIQQVPPLARPAAPAANPAQVEAVAFDGKSEPTSAGLTSLPTENSAAVPFTPAAENAAPEIPAANVVTPLPPDAAAVDSQPSVTATPAVNIPANQPDAPKATVTVAPIPEWWQNYMNRVQEQESTN